MDFLSAHQLIFLQMGIQYTLIPDQYTVEVSQLLVFMSENVKHKDTITICGTENGSQHCINMCAIILEFNQI